MSRVHILLKQFWYVFLSLINSKRHDPTLTSDHLQNKKIKKHCLQKN